jgi:histidine ammonia-lyase
VSLLPHHLSTSPDGWGGTAGLTMMQIAFGEEARHEAARTFLPASESGGFGGQNDVASPTFLAYAKHGRVAWCLDACLASLAVTSSQALHVTSRQAPPQLREFLGAIRDRVPPVEGAHARELGAEVSRLTDAFGTVAIEGTGAIEGLDGILEGS